MTKLSLCELWIYGLHAKLFMLKSFFFMSHIFSSELSLVMMSQAYSFILLLVMGYMLSFASTSSSFASDLQSARLNLLNWNFHDAKFKMTFFSKQQGIFHCKGRVSSNNVQLQMIFSHSSCSSYTTSVVIIISVRALQIGTIILLLNSSVDYCNSSFTLEILELLNCLLPMFKLKLIEGWTISASNQLHELLLKVCVSCSVIKIKDKMMFYSKIIFDIWLFMVFILLCHLFM